MTTPLPPVQFRGITIKFEQGNLFTRHEEILVVGCDPGFSLVAGLGGALSRTCGPELKRAVDAEVQQHGPINEPTAISVPVSRNLYCRHVLLTPLRRSFKHRMQDVFSKVLLHAISLQEPSMVMPPLGTGGFHMVINQCATAFRHALEEIFSFGDLIVISIVDFSLPHLELMREEMIKMSVDDMMRNGNNGNQPAPNIFQQVFSPPSNVNSVQPTRNQRQINNNSQVPSFSQQSQQPLPLPAPPVVQQPQPSPPVSQAQPQPSTSSFKPYADINANAADTSPFRMFYDHLTPEAIAEHRQKRLDEMAESGENAGEMLESCPICLGDMLDEDIKPHDQDSKIVRLTRCPHMFHRLCVVQWFSTKPQCPICNTWYMPTQGTQPADGTMEVETVSRGRLSGYNDRGYIRIKYFFPNGIQQACHPRPGVPYKGTRRTCYLPATEEGEEVAELLEIAFNRRLVFTVGDSVTTGQRNIVTWNGIHHKTSKDGGPSNFGYPDPNYIQRVMAELAAVNITPELLEEEESDESF